MVFKLLISGATGTAGAEVVRQALLNDSITTVTVLIRRPLPPHIASTSPKLHSVIHNDFTSYPPNILDQFKDHDAVIWAQGISSLGFNEQDYSKITIDYPLAAAHALAKAKGPNDKWVFCYLSGEGADQDESKTMFARVKGQAEHQVAQLRSTYPGLSTYSFRPGGIIPVQPVPDAGRLQKFTNAIAPLLRPFFGSSLINTDDLANGMIQAALKGGDGTISGWEGKGASGNAGVFRNEEIKRLAKGRSKDDK